MVPFITNSGKPSLRLNGKKYRLHKSIKPKGLSANEKGTQIIGRRLTKVIGHYYL